MTALNDFYGFRQTPFSKSITGQDLFPSRGHQEIQGRLAFALQEHLPALITGDVGTGKSTALRAFAHSLDRNLYTVVYLSNPHLSVTTLYHQILLALQTEPAFGFSRLLPQLRSTLSDFARKGRFTLLVVDEAHLLPPQLFDQLRFLLNDDMDSASLLTLVLLGQPELAGSEPRKLDSMLSKKPMIYCNQRRFTWPRNDGPLHQTSSSRSYWNC